ncbi:MAG TPA: non-ribosomal peptide synthetase [Trinickia sp.]|nr:non-ribosomal peptide synthetase [Trinickia sp.]
MPRKVAHWTQWHRDTWCNVPIADALPLLEAAREEAAGIDALQVDLVDRPVELNAAGAAVRILCRPTGDMLSVIVVCADDDPWAEGCDAVAELYAELFHALLTNRAAKPAEASGLGAVSRQSVLGPLAGEAFDYGPWVAIPRMIERNAERYPERPAYCFEERWLSYRDFDGLANALAALFAARGVGKGALVPVLLENSLELPIAYHALMKLGAAFVPLDRAWPAKRIEHALHTLAGAIVVCSSAHDVPALFRQCAVPVDISALTPAAHRPPIDIAPEDAIYGIFTSGTTGEAKCALNHHGGLANRFRFMSRYFERAHGNARILQNTRHTFDSSVWQLFWPLTTGAQVVIPKHGAFLDLESTVETIARHRITMTDFVPSVFNQVVALAERDPGVCAKLSTLEALIVGGEEITPSMVHKLRAILPRLRVTNAYGPTETSIGMVFHPVETADGMAIPIGRPIDNCYVIVVDDELRPLPPGACGELLIGGVCVGSGYFKQPELTSRVFIDNPFPTIPGDKLYRTGDLGYFDSQGRLRFVGRKDFQVKVGGVRIELGEIEAAAQRCAQVREAKALVAAHGGCNSIALFVTGERSLDRVMLDQHLRGILPRASVPRHYFVLSAMPLAESGKVDRRKLQAQLDTYLAGDEPVHAAPAASASPLRDTAARVLGVFVALLGRPDLRANEDFFAAGGDSLQALAATMELERLFHVRFSVHDLLDNASAAKAAARIDCLIASGEAEEGDEALMARDARYVEAAHAARLDAREAVPHAWANAPRAVFLTGATGFVGGWLAKALLDRRDDLQLFVLSRRGHGDAQQDLIDLFKRKRIWDERYTDRIHAVNGDLVAPGLGIDPATRDMLAARCDAIVHCGALVNFLYDYRAHRAANVLATKDLLELARAKRLKPIHFISTLGTLEGEAENHASPLAETLDPERAACPRSGYSRSKWVAERLMLDARAKGVPVTVFRLGEVMPAAPDGIPNARALTHFLLSAIVRMKARPAVAIRSDWSPVDYVARRVVTAIFDVDAWNRAYHVFHPDSICFARAFERAGVALATLSCGEWLAELDARIAQGGPRELSMLRSLLPQAGGSDAALAAAFEAVLTNNPLLFSRAGCETLERRHGLDGGDVHGAVAAYGRYLSQSMLHAGLPV